ncbi:hypothetical protein IE077_000623 [Cardiosporidium cionae]|uniref:Cysteine dioxygenase n=1 Tax=Cardiosporidium cionae TaxID=476202 RepID=A0ABQ7JFH0_9APIC|nr:hypothetical protein IE077_000623 [Cardiosporidium cionae]|eukprot:KAF8822400.1 hypothetical protein IE077_000623 [Cardiosporidium cionae]
MRTAGKYPCKLTSAFATDRSGSFVRIFCNNSCPLFSQSLGTVRGTSSSMHFRDLRMSSVPAILKARIYSNYCLWGVGYSSAKIPCYFSRNSFPLSCPNIVQREYSPSRGSFMFLSTRLGSLNKLGEPVGESASKINTMAINKMQAILNSAHAIFSGNNQEFRTPTFNEIFSLRKLLGKCTLEDCGYTETSLQQAIDDAPTSPETVHVIPIYSNEQFTIVVFVLRKGQVVDMHDHSGMVVVSKLLLGRLHMTVANLDEFSNFPSVIVPSSKVPFFGTLPPPAPSGTVFDGTIVFDDIISKDSSPIANSVSSSISPKADRAAAHLEYSPAPFSSSEMEECGNGLESLPSKIFPDTILAFPSAGNTHELRAEAPLSVFLDIIAPPYEIPKERICRFFQVLPQRHPKPSCVDRKTTDSRVNTRMRFKLLVSGGPEFFHSLPYGQHRKYPN